MPSSTQRVELASGGNLVVTMALDLFALNESDRTFVFDIIDKVKTYREATLSKDSLDQSPSQGEGDE